MQPLKRAGALSKAGRHLCLLVLGTLEVRAGRQGSLVECAVYDVAVERDKGVDGVAGGGGAGSSGAREARRWCGVILVECAVYGRGCREGRECCAQRRGGRKGRETGRERRHLSRSSSVSASPASVTRAVQHSTPPPTSRRRGALCPLV
jgi:hypothetical protein